MYTHLNLSLVAIAMSLIVSGCSGPGYQGSIRPTVGVGFYHSTYGAGWGGYYPGYDAGVVDTIDTIDAVDTIDSIGMPDVDMGLDF